MIGDLGSCAARLCEVGTRLQALFEEEKKYYVAEIVAVEMRPFVKARASPEFRDAPAKGLNGAVFKPSKTRAQQNSRILSTQM